MKTLVELCTELFFYSFVLKGITETSMPVNVQPHSAEPPTPDGVKQKLKMADESASCDRALGHFSGGFALTSNLPDIPISDDHVMQSKTSTDSLDHAQTDHFISPELLSDNF